MDHQVEQSALRHPPVVLDTDSSVGALPGEIRLALNDDWREAIRFGCRQGVLRSCMRNLTSRMPAPADHGTVFMGSGDFHHLSWPLIERCAAGAPRQPARGGAGQPSRQHALSLGRALRLLGAPRRAAAAGGARARHRHHFRRPGRRACLGTQPGFRLERQGHVLEHRRRYALVALAGPGAALSQLPDRATLVEAARQELAARPMDTYFSIDKDAFSADEVRTNWDQGVLLRADLKTLAQALHGQIVGSDVTGDVSVWHYRTAWKRWLSAADGQDTAHQDRNCRNGRRARTRSTGRSSNCWTRRAR